MIEKVKIEKINVQQPKTGKNKNGRNFRCWPVGIKTPEKWLNQNLFKEQDLDYVKEHGEGDEILLDIYQDKWKGKAYDRFRVPGEIDLLEFRVDRMEVDIDRLKGVINELIRKNNLNFR